MSESATARSLVFEEPDVGSERAWWEPGALSSMMDCGGRYKRLEREERWRRSGWKEERVANLKREGLVLFKLDEKDGLLVVNAHRLALSVSVGRRERIQASSQRSDEERDETR